MFDRVKSFFGLPVYARTPINSLTVQNYIKSTLKLSTLGDYELTGITYMEVNVADKNHGIILLRKLHEITNNYVRKRDLNRIDKYLSFITNQLEKNDNQDVKLALVGTLNQYLKKKVVTAVDFDYAVEPLEKLQLVSIQLSLICMLS